MGLVTNPDGRILLVKTGRRGWEPPGGQVELGEDLIAALEREILEESRCVVRVGRLLGVYSNVGGLGIVMFTFLCSHVSGEPCGGDECTEAGWFTCAEVLRLVTHPAQAPKLREALAALDSGNAGGVVYRVYRTVRETDPTGTVRSGRYELLAERRC